MGETSGEDVVLSQLAILKRKSSVFFQEICSLDLKVLMHYFSVILTTGLVNFIPVLVLVRMFDTIFYSKFILIKNLIFVIVSFCGSGMSQAVVKWINAGYKDKNKIYIGSLVGVILSSFPATVLFFISSYVIGVDVNIPVTVINFALIFGIVLFQCLNFEIINWKRADGRAQLYSLYTFVRSFLLTLISLSGVYYFRSLLSYFLFLLISECIFFIVIGVREIINLKPSFHDFSMKTYREMFSYGWPSSFIIVNSILLNVVDRIMISMLDKSQGAVAIYDAVYVLSTAAIYILYRVINLYLPPRYIKIYYSNGEKAVCRFISKVNNTYLLVGCIISSLILVLKSQLISFFYPDDYLAGLKIVFPIVMGVLISGLCSGLSSGYVILGKMHVTSSISFFSAIVNIVLNVFFIPRWGIVGASYATLISFFIQILAISILSKKYIYIRLPYTGVCLTFLFLFLIENVIA